MKKLVVADPLPVRHSIRAEVMRSQDQLLLHQLHCVLLIGLGRSCREVACWFGDSPRTIERWVGLYNRVGTEGLCHHHPAGRPSRIPAETSRRLAFELHQPPGVCGYSDAHWEGALLMDHLARHYGINLGLRQCQRILQRLRGTPGARGRPATGADADADAPSI